MNNFLVSSLRFTFRSAVIVAITLFVMFLALFYFHGFGILLLITLLVMERVAHYVRRLTTWWSL